MSMLCFFEFFFCSENKPSGPVARLGSRPVIDGKFEKGEWDDMVVLS